MIVYSQKKSMSSSTAKDLDGNDSYLTKLKEFDSLSVSDQMSYDLLNNIIIELKKLNTYMYILSDNHITDSDINIYN